MMRGIGNKYMTESYASNLGYFKGKTRKNFEDFKYLSKCNDLPKEGDVDNYNELYESFQSL